MEMNVMSWGPTEDNGRSAKLGISRALLNDVIQASDFLCVCLRLSDLTRALLKKPQLELMKTGAGLVNTSRAEIIEKEALYSELASGRISAALDVYHQEPLTANDRLRKLPNVLLSPHMGYVTQEVYDVFFTQVVENIQAWHDGKPYRDALGGPTK
jgi:phosphoglycerate dehydrogenase-like enzyme